VLDILYGVLGKNNTPAETCRRMWQSSLEALWNDCGSRTGKKGVERERSVYLSRAFYNSDFVMRVSCRMLNAEL
jgi:hypothetical protein